MPLQPLGRRPTPLRRARGGEPAVPVYEALGGAARDVGAGGDELRLLGGEIGLGLGVGLGL